MIGSRYAVAFRHFDVIVDGPSVSFCRGHRCSNGNTRENYDRYRKGANPAQFQSVRGGPLCRAAQKGANRAAIGVEKDPCLQPLCCSALSLQATSREARGHPGNILSEAMGSPIPPLFRSALGNSDYVDRAFGEKAHGQEASV